MKVLLSAIALFAAPAAWAQQDPGDVPARKAPVVQAPAADPELAAVYNNALGKGWENWSFATVEIGVDIGSARKPIRVEADGYKALYLHHAAFDTTPYRGLSFLIQGTGAGGKVRIVATIDGKPFEEKYKVIEVKPGGWTKMLIPLGDFGAAKKSIDGIWFQNDGADPLPPFYVADIALAE